MTVLVRGSNVGGIIGHPSLLELVRADAVAPSSGPGPGTGTVTSTSTVHGRMNGHGGGRSPEQKQDMNGGCEQGHVGPMVC